MSVQNSCLPNRKIAHLEADVPLEQPREVDVASLAVEGATDAHVCAREEVAAEGAGGGNSGVRILVSGESRQLTQGTGQNASRTVTDT